MNNSQHQKGFNCPFKMESIIRITSIPIVESGVKTAELTYNNLKKKSKILNWSFETAESVVLAAVESIRPAAKLIEGPIGRIDSLMCHGLDIMENKIPSVYLPPQMIYWNTKEYMSDRLVRPVVKRANSVKQFGNAVLDSRVSAYAANRIDGAIDVADKYVDRYLPTEDQVDGQNSTGSQNDIKNGSNKAFNTFHKGQRFSRKLKRRLTERTFAEARALKKQSKDAIHILIYTAELLVTDPKLALQKARELWAYLSGDEPENQARPKTLEQLIILLTRESARRLVHLVNFANRYVSTVPRSALLSLQVLIHQFGYVAESLLKIAHFDKVSSLAMQESTALIRRLQVIHIDLWQTSASMLDRLVVLLTKRIEAEKMLGESTADQCGAGGAQQTRLNNNPPQNSNANGIY